VRARVHEIHLVRAARRAHEGSELYVDGARARLVLALTPARFAAPEELGTFCLRECLYAEDMLDPAVAYAPVPAHELAHEPARVDLVRDRLRVLWEARIRGRLARLGTVEPEGRPTPAFVHAFEGALDAAQIEELHSGARNGALATFPELLATARA
jgi:hypothetical protein